VFNVTRNNLYIFLHWPHRLLDRNQVDDEESVEDDEDDEFLKGFKVANFEYIDEAKALAEKEEARRKAAAEAANSERANYWDELLKHRYDVQKVEEHTAMGKGKRSRKQMAAADEDDIHDLSSEDEDYSFEDDVSDNDTNLQGNVSGRRGQYKRKSRNVDLIPLMEGEGRTLRVLGFNNAQRSLFLQTLNRLVTDSLIPLKPVLWVSEYCEFIVYVQMSTCYLHRVIEQAFTISVLSVSLAHWCIFINRFLFLLLVGYC